MTQFGAETLQGLDEKKNSMGIFLDTNHGIVLHKLEYNGIYARYCSRLVSESS